MQGLISPRNKFLDVDADPAHHAADVPERIYGAYSATGRQCTGRRRSGDYGRPDAHLSERGAALRSRAPGLQWHGLRIRACLAVLVFKKLEYGACIGFQPGLRVPHRCAAWIIGYLSESMTDDLIRVGINRRGVLVGPDSSGRTDTLPSRIPEGSVVIAS